MSGRPRLHYFDMPGIAEAVRIMFTMAGTEFEDIRFPYSRWTEIKPTAPTGVAPWLEVEGSTVLVESVAIWYYVAKTTAMLPSDPVDEAKALCVASFYPSNIIGQIRALRIMSPEDRAKAMPEVENEKLPALYAVYENLVKQYQIHPNFAIGTTHTVADAQVYAAVLVCFGNNPIGFRYNAVEKNCPTLFAIYRNVAEHPAVREYRAKHGQ